MGPCRLGPCVPTCALVEGPGPCLPPWALLASTLGPCWPLLWAPLSPHGPALLGRALVGALGPCRPPGLLRAETLWAKTLWAPLGPCEPPWALVARALLGLPGPLGPSLGPTDWPRVTPTIGHGPRDDRRRHRSWTWRWPGQLRDDPQSASHKRGGRCKRGWPPPVCVHLKRQSTGMHLGALAPMKMQHKEGNEFQGGFPEVEPTVPRCAQSILQSCVGIFSNAKHTFAKRTWDCAPMLANCRATQLPTLVPGCHAGNSTGESSAMPTSHPLSSSMATSDTTSHPLSDSQPSNIPTSHTAVPSGVSCTRAACPLGGGEVTPPPSRTYTCGC